MEIKQWEDENLAHFSYAILSTCEKKIILIDPARNPQPYLDFAAKQEAQITGIIETHPHADFVSSHLELHNTTGAPVYASKLSDASYLHKTFDDGDVLQFGKIKLSAINTPGHSPDSICILLEHDGKQKALFTGDTLFVGDIGRPDLREAAGNINETREALAQKMYHSLRDKLMPLNDDVIIYPAHGAGTLCGKSVSKAESSTLKAEKQTNWALQPLTEKEFTTNLLSDQPFVPPYFSYDVALNLKGAPSFNESLSKVKMGGAIATEKDAAHLQKSIWIVDARAEKEFKKAHLPHSLNIMQEGKFETWLGSMIQPGEEFYLAAENDGDLKKLLPRVAAIGYEAQIKEAFVVQGGHEEMKKFDVAAFKKNRSAYTIVDVRDANEVKAQKIFHNSINIPLAELTSRVSEIPLAKPIVVHCTGGYRSAVGSSVLQAALNGQATVYDLGEAVKKFIE